MAPRMSQHQEEGFPRQNHASCTNMQRQSGGGREGWMVQACQETMGFVTVQDQDNSCARNIELRPRLCNLLQSMEQGVETAADLLRSVASLDNWWQTVCREQRIQTGTSCANESDGGAPTGSASTMQHRKISAAVNQTVSAAK